jgi:NADPH:quinone reductase-like Zn-dependent oxidoreductase
MLTFASARSVHSRSSFSINKNDVAVKPTALIIRPVVDRVFPFASTKEAMAYVEAGRAKGKVVVSLG